jgi:hypothetical protein
VLLYAAGYLTAMYALKTPAPVEPRAVAPPPAVKAIEAKAPAAATTLASPTTPLALRVAVATTPEDAQAQVASLTAVGLKPTVVQMPTSSGVVLHNVYVGSYNDRASANAAATELQSRLGISAAIVPAPAPSNL